MAVSNEERQSTRPTLFCGGGTRDSEDRPRLPPARRAAVAVVDPDFVFSYAEVLGQLDHFRIVSAVIQM